MYELTSFTREKTKIKVILRFMPRRSFHKACIVYIQSDVVSDGPYICRNHERILIKFGSGGKVILFSFLLFGSFSVSLSPSPLSSSVFFSLFFFAYPFAIADSHRVFRKFTELNAYFVFKNRSSFISAGFNFNSLVSVLR